MADITREEFQKLADDLIQVKNDVNTIKANTQLTESILSLLNSRDIIDYVFNVAKTERLCKALILCKESKTAKVLSDALEIKQQNFLRDIYNKLGDSLLRRRDEGNGRITYIRTEYLDTIGFDKIAANKYPNLKELI